MHVQLLRFDRVFSVVRHHTQWGKWTQFGFEFDGLRVGQASVYGHPTIPIGIELNVATPKKGDWQSICGWKRAGTSEVFVDHEQSGIAATSVLFTAFLLFVGFMYIANFSTLNSGQHIFFVLCSASTATVLALELRRSLRIRRAEKVLRSS
jgi:hypothetical protein